MSSSSSWGGASRLRSSLLLERIFLLDTILLASWPPGLLASWPHLRGCYESLTVTASRRAPETLTIRRIELSLSTEYLRWQVVLHTLCFPHITTYKEDHCIVHTEILTIAMASVGKLHFKEIFQIFRHWQHFLHGLAWCWTQGWETDGLLVHHKVP